MKENGRLISKLKRLYSNKISRDEFGKRKATARERESALHCDFLKHWQDHLPTDNDIKEKDD